MANDFYVDGKELKNIKIKLGDFEKQIPGATASALNRTLTYTATQTNRLVREEYSIKAKDVKKTIKKHKASKSNLYAYLESTGHTISLGRFPHKPRKYSKRGKPVEVKIKKSSGYKKVNTNPKAFVQNMNGATNVFKRVGKKRLPVRVLRTLSVPQMISNPDRIKKIQEAAGKKLEERVQHEINWRLNKASKRR